jgi:fructan beta-fructosidase
MPLMVLMTCLSIWARFAGMASEPYRPHYHFTSQRNWINDPNGLVFFAGEYHLFFQYNPFGDRWGHMSWGHAVSQDLIRWTPLPVALSEADGTMIFSGSAVVDWSNTSGLGRGSEPPIIAVYTGNRISDGRQAQCLAFSNDRGRNWSPYSQNPVLDIESRNFRDPKVFWYARNHQWIMVVSLAEKRAIEFYSSSNLKNWAVLGQFGPTGATNGVWECPDLFPLPVEGHPSRTAWVLLVNVGSSSPSGGSGTQYFIGQFDGHTFIPALTQNADQLWADYGRDCYAAVSWSDLPKSDGRRVWIGWMSNWEYAQDLPTTPWRNALTIPRELTLRDTGQGLRLVQSPVRELKQLREARQHFGGGDVAQANQWLRKRRIYGDSLEMLSTWKPGLSGQFGLRVLKGEQEETVIGFDEASKQVFVDRTHSGNVGFNKSFPGLHHAAARVRHDEISLHLFIDACSCELFVNDGELVFTDLVFPSSTSRQLEFFSRASRAIVNSAEVWSLRPAFAGR